MDLWDWLHGPIAPAADALEPWARAAGASPFDDDAGTYRGGVPVTLGHDRGWNRRTYTVQNQAIGAAAWALVVPSDKQWRLVFVEFALALSAAPGARHVMLFAQTPSGDLVFRAINSNQATNQSQISTWARGLTQANDSNLNEAPLGDDVLLLGNVTLRGQVFNLDAGDQIINLTVVVDESTFP